MIFKRYNTCGCLYLAHNTSLTSLTYLDLDPPVPLTSEHRSTRSLHLSWTLAILRAPCQLTPISSRSSSKVLRHVFFGIPSLFCCLQALTRCIAMGGSFFMQSDDVASYFPSLCSDNVLKSLHACPPHHVFICA